jgi:hypothetical protein
LIIKISLLLTYLVDISKTPIRYDSSQNKQQNTKQQPQNTNQNINNNNTSIVLQTNKKVVNFEREEWCLFRMGFNNEKLNREILSRYSGSLVDTLEFLLGSH